MLFRLTGCFLLAAFIAISSWYVETQYTAVSIRRALNDDAVDGDSCRFFFKDNLHIINAKNGWSKQDPTGKWKIEIVAKTVEENLLELNWYEANYLVGYFGYFPSSPTTTFKLWAEGTRPPTLVHTRQISFYPKNKQNDNWAFSDSLQCEAGDDDWKPSIKYEYLFQIIKNKAHCIISVSGSEMTINTQNSWKYEGSGWKVNMVANAATKQLELVIFQGNNYGVEIRWVLTNAPVTAESEQTEHLSWDINGKLKQDWKGKVRCIVGKELEIQPNAGGWRYDLLLREVPWHYEQRSTKRKAEVPEDSCLFSVDSHRLLIGELNGWKKKDDSGNWEIEMFADEGKNENYLVVRITNFLLSPPVENDKFLEKPKSEETHNELYWKLSEEDDDGIVRCKYKTGNSLHQYELLYDEVRNKNIKVKYDNSETVKFEGKSSR